MKMRSHGTLPKQDEEEKEGEGEGGGVGQGRPQARVAEVEVAVAELLRALTVAVGLTFLHINTG